MFQSETEINSRKSYEYYQFLGLLTLDQYYKSVGIIDPQGNVLESEKKRLIDDTIDVWDKTLEFMTNWANEKNFLGFQIEKPPVTVSTTFSGGIFLATSEGKNLKVALGISNSLLQIASKKGIYNLTQLPPYYLYNDFGKKTRKISLQIQIIDFATHEFLHLLHYLKNHEKLKIREGNICRKNQRFIN